MFDPSLADVAVVVEDDGRWRLDVRRFTGDVIATTPLHVDGAFQPRVLALVTRMLARWDVAASAEWDGHHGTWSALLNPAPAVGQRPSPVV
ncbi:hypothetical protein NVV95_16380 [Herbiconiux sp. CPCC 205716]|uniref:Uncharacterized protein n=1 Tax=Herbiconiux gentiana TaxID=2970912 RepID=A0ABT2GIS1_9MICO|nr:hypothetical protein [Herbiconiux gentiana]MCS5716124.1 hypothetical protein [Herbiconiux gentiana]